MEVGVVFDGALILLEPAALRSNGAIEVVDGFEVLVDERLVDKGPEALSGLEFRAAWRLIDEPYAIRNWKIFRAMPAGIIKLQEDGAIAAGIASLPSASSATKSSRSSATAENPHFAEGRCLRSWRRLERQ